ncbi:hypothetical protein [Spirillospora sp. NBC_01491]|uniref:hypothetical protein n=1 Tax=Spirillospora sp. NBC_01491 TaxID=2976007 RepID=UPI002E341ABB|nr:hypothetical protein [Spirillospora sp. NBC_01491]
MLRNGQDYWLVSQQVNEQWARPDGQTWMGSRGLDSVPMSAKDGVAWRKDGKPNGERLPARLEKDSGTDAFLLCDKGMSLKQVQALPTDPAALKNTLSRMLPPEKPVPGSLSRDQLVQGCLTDLLSHLPAQPKVRAAAYRVLAAMPRVTVGGKVTDERGRKGVEVRTKGRGGTADKMIIDTRSSLVLVTSRTVPGIPGVPAGQVYLQVGWTDAGPKVPALP